MLLVAQEDGRLGTVVLPQQRSGCHKQLLQGGFGTVVERVAGRED